MDRPAATWVIDLDGVIWLSGQAIDGGAEAVVALRRAGRRVLFATNNSRPSAEQLVAQLDGVGIPSGPGEVLSSADALASLVDPGATVLAVCGAGARQALAARGVRLVQSGPADAVVVGLTTAFDYDLLARAASAVRGGARLLGTNDDATVPTPTGPLPGAGSLLAAVATAAGAVPLIAGKPHRPMADLIAAAAPLIELVVGDRPDTDGHLARQLGAPFGLVRSGVTPPGTDPGHPPPDHDAPDLATLVSGYLGG